MTLGIAPTVVETTLPELDGLTKDVLVLASDPVVADVELSGPVRKKFPARGGPRLSVSLKMVRLKLLRGVSGVMSIGASVSKLEGCSKRSTMYLHTLYNESLQFNNALDITLTGGDQSLRVALGSRRVSLRRSCS